MLILDDFELFQFRALISISYLSPVSRNAQFGHIHDFGNSPDLNSKTAETINDPITVNTWLNTEHTRNISTIRLHYIVIKGQICQKISVTAI